jgi:hypothetical protein
MGRQAEKPHEYWLAGFSGCCIMVHFQIEKCHVDLIVQNSIYIFQTHETAF